MLQGWPESQSSSSPSISFPQLDTTTIMRDGAFMSSGRQRTSQACDKCRERKTKCSGERPVCKRCAARGLICAYSCREPRSRGPSRPRMRGTSAIQLPFVNPIPDPKPPPPAPPKLPQVELPRGAMEAQQRISRPLHYRTMSMTQLPSVLPARTHVKTGSLATLPEPSRHFVSHDFSQLQSRRLGSSMFSSAQVAQSMAQDIGQVPGFPLFGTGNRALFNTNLVKPTYHSNTSLMAPAPNVRASLDYGRFDRQFQPLQGTTQLPLDSNNGGSLGFVDRSTPPPLSHSTSSSVTHSPSTSSDHDREAHYQNIANFERLMASFADPVFYQNQADIPQAPTSHASFGSLEPSPLIQPCFKVGSERNSLSTVSEGADYRHGNTNLELQYPTPVTPIGMERLETVVDSPTLSK